MLGVKAKYLRTYLQDLTGEQGGWHGMMVPNNVQRGESIKIAYLYCDLVEKVEKN